MNDDHDHCSLCRKRVPAGMAYPLCEPCWEAEDAREDEARRRAEWQALAYGPGEPVWDADW